MVTWTGGTCGACNEIGKVTWDLPPRVEGYYSNLPTCSHCYTERAAEAVVGMQTTNTNLEQRVLDLELEIQKIHEALRDKVPEDLVQLLRELQ